MIYQIFKKKVIKFINYIGYDLTALNPISPDQALIYELEKRHKSDEISLQEIEKLARREKAKYLLTALRSLNNNRLSLTELKTISRILKYTNNHSCYENAIKKYDPELNIYSSKKIKAAEFIGRGLGSGNLNTYRKLKLDNIVLFEKIYENNSNAIKNLDWFLIYVQHHLDSKYIRTPEVYQINKGRYLSAVYFEYVDLSPYVQGEHFARAIDITKYFYQLDLPCPKDIPSEILIFNKDGWYRKGLSEAINFVHGRRLGNIEIISALEQKITCLTRRFSHGDISKRNLAQKLYVLDWDNCGYYPLGYDIAKFLSRSYVCDTSDQLLFFLEKNFAEDIKHTHWNEFIFSCLFFSFVFYNRSKFCSNDFLIDTYRLLLHHLNR